MAEQFEVIKRELKVSGDFARIIPVSCMHIGHRQFNETKCKSYLKYILNTPDTYAIMLGDTIENVLPETANRHRGSMHDQILDVEKQRLVAAEMLAPLAEAKKIICWTESNHSLRSWFEAGFSVEGWIADQLGVKFAGLDAFLELKVGKQIYSIHATHGNGGGTSLQSVMGKLVAQTYRVPGADVYVRGHHHRKMLADPPWINGRTGEIKKQLLAATGCFMDYIGGYGHRGAMAPVDVGCVKVKLYRKQWDIHGTL